MQNKIIKNIFILTLPNISTTFNMKIERIFFAGVFFLCLSSSVFSQLHKGTWMVGGNLGFQSAKNTSTFYMNPNLGYFFVNRVVAGMAFSYYNSPTSFLSMGPFLRACAKLNNVSLFAHTRFVYTNTDKEGFANDQMGFGIGPGLGIFLNDFVALEGLMEYYIPEVDKSASSMGFNLSLQVYFPKK
jgi:hypothetical protein